LKLLPNEASPVKEFPPPADAADAIVEMRFIKIIREQHAQLK